MKKYLLFLLGIFFTTLSFSQAVTPRGSAAVTVQDMRQIIGLNFFLPHYTDTTAANLSKGIDSSGAVIFTYDINGLWYRNSNPKKWVLISTSGSIGSTAWLLTGNSGTVDGTNFLGTTDNVPLNFRANNQKVGRIEVDPTTANTFYGYQSGNVNTAFGNTAYGYQSLNANTSGGSNTAIGLSSMSANTTGFDNTAVGLSSLRSNDIGIHNTAIGFGALYTNTSGSNNTAIGMQTLAFTTTGSYNTASGYQALFSNVLGNYNTANGYLSLQNTTSSGNTANGYAALNVNSTGAANVAIGFQSLQNNSTASFNTAVGYNSAHANTTGAGIVAIGYESFLKNTTGTENTAIGYQTLHENTFGNYNTAVGKNVLYNTTTGSWNTGFGKDAVSSNSSGSRNAGFGYAALLSNTLGSNNTAFGASANVLSNNLTNATAFGYNSRIGIDSAASYGDTLANIKHGFGTAFPTERLDVRGSVKIVDGTQGLNKILTSDANGKGSWQTAAANVNIYNSDGFLTSNRGLDQNGHTLTIDDGPIGNTTGSLRIGTDFGVLAFGMTPVTPLSDAEIQGENELSIRSRSLVIRPTDSLFITTPLKISSNSTDSVLMRSVSGAIRIKAFSAGGAGTVTSVATGYGLSGGTITTTGTLIVDSATLSNYYLRKKDSIAGGYYPYSSNPKGYLTSTSGTAWGLLGNASTVDGTNFVGTTDNIPLNFRVNNQKAGRIDGTNSNTLFGYQAGNGVITGGSNSGFGTSALFSNTSGFGNTATGSAALYTTTNGFFNTANGASALLSTTSGGNNTAMGATTLYSNTTGGNNLAAGYSALAFNTIGTNNVGIGYEALYVNTQGGANTGLGYKADVLSNTLLNATAIGANSKIGISNGISLGDSTTSTKTGIGTSFPDHTLMVRGDFKLVDGTQGANKILTSDANGGASWQTATSVNIGNSDLTLTSTRTLSGATLYPLNINNLTGFAISVGTTGGIQADETFTGLFSPDGTSSFTANSDDDLLLNTSTGNIYINGSEPTLRFHNQTIGGSANSYLNFENSSNFVNAQLILANDGDQFYLQSNKYSGVPFYANLVTAFTGIQTFSPNSTLSIDGSMSNAYQSKTSTYTITEFDYFVDAVSGTFTITLPTAVGCRGRHYVIKNSGTGVLTIATTSSQTIDGASTKILGVQYGGYNLTSDNINWKITGTF